ncbi:Hypothetical predicted protein, partial [Paramuricea clavata]
MLGHILQDVDSKLLFHRQATLLTVIEIFSLIIAEAAELGEEGYSPRRKSGGAGQAVKVFHGGKGGAKNRLSRICLGYKAHNAKVKEAVAYITEIACNYEALVKQSKEKYGSSM